MARMCAIVFGGLATRNRVCPTVQRYDIHAGIWDDNTVARLPDNMAMTNGYAFVLHTTNAGNQFTINDDSKYTPISTSTSTLVATKSNKMIAILGGHNPGHERFHHSILYSPLANRYVPITLLQWPSDLLYALQPKISMWNDGSLLVIGLTPTSDGNNSMACWMLPSYIMQLIIDIAAASVFNRPHMSLNINVQQQWIRIPDLSMPSYQMSHIIC
jgi:hypothetical protein